MTGDVAYGGVCAQPQKVLKASGIFASIHKEHPFLTSSLLAIANSPSGISNYPKFDNIPEERGGNMSKRMVLHFSLMLCVLLSVACSSRPKDEQIQKDIQTKAAADPDTKDSAINVAAKDGKVTLTGTVRNEAAGKEIKKIAKEEPGVTDVDDQTSIDTSIAPSAAPIAAATRTAAPKPPPPPPPPVVPAGTVLTVRLSQGLSSKTSQTGQTFLAILAQPISVGGKPVLAAGSTVSGTVVTAKAKGKFKGEGQLDVKLTSITTSGHAYQIQTNVLSNAEKGKGKRTAATTGGGAAGGALIGGLAGGGKGAAIGAAVGAGAGLVGGAMTGNKQVEFPAESPLSFTLTQPVTVAN